MDNNEIVYFELNNWFAGRDYPDAEPFLSWMSDDLNLRFSNEEWVKENNLCVVVSNVDMSTNYCITAPKEFVLKNCPDLLSDKSYTYKISSSSKDGVKVTEYTEYFKNFVCVPDEDCDLPDSRFGIPFLEWSPENVGKHYWDYDEQTWDED